MKEACTCTVGQRHTNTSSITLTQYGQVCVSQDQHKISQQQNILILDPPKTILLHENREFDVVMAEIAIFDCHISQFNELLQRHPKWVFTPSIVYRRPTTRRSATAE